MEGALGNVCPRFAGWQLGQLLSCVNATGWLRSSGSGVLCFHFSFHSIVVYSLRSLCHQNDAHRVATKPRVETLVHWCSRNTLVLNVSKCHSMCYFLKSSPTLFFYSHGTHHYTEVPSEVANNALISTMFFPIAFALWLLPADHLRVFNSIEAFLNVA